MNVVIPREDHTLKDDHESTKKIKSRDGTTKKVGITDCFVLRALLHCTCVYSALGY